jgi:hypothetical protein
VSDIPNTPEALRRAIEQSDWHQKAPTALPVAASQAPDFGPSIHPKRFLSHETALDLETARAHANALDRAINSSIAQNHSVTDLDAARDCAYNLAHNLAIITDLDRDFTTAQQIDAGTALALAHATDLIRALAHAHAHAHAHKRSTNHDIASGIDRDLEAFDWAASIIYGLIVYAAGPEDEPGSDQSSGDQTTTAIEWALRWNSAALEALTDENSQLRRQIDAANLREGTLRIEVKRLTEMLRQSNENLEAANRKPGLRQSLGLVVLGSALTFAGLVGNTVIAEQLASDQPPAVNIETGEINANSVVFGDITNHLCTTAVVLNPDLATSVSSLPFFEPPEVD